MKNLRKFMALFVAVFASCFFVSCSNSSGGGDNTPQPQRPTIYTVIFNANDGSANPATVPQNFTAGIPQTLTSVEELGFSKAGFYFAGWGTAPKSKQAKYADEASYTAVANETLYALWSEIPVYSVRIMPNEHGTFASSPATGTVGTEITLNNTPAVGWRFEYYIVTDSDGTAVTVTDGKFTMPAKDVTVTANFTAIDYSIKINSTTNGTIIANIADSTTPATAANYGQTVTLSSNPESGYQLTVVTVIASDGTSVVINRTGSNRTFSMPAQDVTVTATFAILPPAVNGTYTKIGTTIINGTSYDLVTFGLWPQTIKSDDVTVNKSETKTVGDFTYCRGSDGQWYVKIKECPYTTNYKYSDGTDITISAFNSYKWFKVEPIKWRVLTKNYNGTGKKLMLAESILIAKCYDASKNNYQNSEMRKWLNSNANSAVLSDHADSNGFLKTAFTASELAAIEDISVDNSVRSSLPDNDIAAQALNNGNNQYASDTLTTDKIFLLSEREATKSEFGFDDGIFSTECNALIRQTTDYAKAGGAYQDKTNGKGGFWWLRSPFYDYENNEFMVGHYGTAGGSSNVNHSFVGVVPALCVSAASVEPKYTITIPDSFEGGAVTSDRMDGLESEMVTLTVTPQSDYYRLGFVSVTTADGTNITLKGTGDTRTFAMPAKNVTINAKFESKHTISIPDFFEGGTASADKMIAFPGETVTLSINPAFAYQLEALTIANSNGVFETLSGTGDIRTFIMPAQNVTVTATFKEIPAATGEYTRIGSTEFLGTQYDLVTFGLWPQTIKAANVTVNKNVTEIHGAFTYCKGSDGQWYVELAENACDRNYNYSDGTNVACGGTSVKWFRVEPIAWRVLVKNDNGNKLLFAEKVITNCEYFYTLSNRTIGGKTVYPNNYEHSSVRAFLNGLSYQKSSATQTTCDDFLEKGFLQSAFTSEQASAVKATSVDNSAKSTNPDGWATGFNNGENQYASITPTIDKIFLLSEQEATKRDYGFVDYNRTTNPGYASRVKRITDFAMANGAKDSCWWLRSPDYKKLEYASYVRSYGFADMCNYVYNNYGVVPALWLE